jgi:hypothetical protein
VTFGDFRFPSEWPGFALSCFNTKKRKPVMVLVEMREPGRRTYVGEVEFPSDSRGWTGERPLTKAAREAEKAERERHRGDTCLCGSELPWHLTRVTDERFHHFCSCGLRWDWASPTSMRHERL